MVVGRFFSGVSWRLFCAGKSPFPDNASLLCHWPSENSPRFHKALCSLLFPSLWLLVLSAPRVIKETKSGEAGQQSGWEPGSLGDCLLLCCFALKRGEGHFWVIAGVGTLLRMEELIYFKGRGENTSREFAPPSLRI